MPMATRQKRWLAYYMNYLHWLSIGGDQKINSWSLLLCSNRRLNNKYVMDRNNKKI